MLTLIKTIMLGLTIAVLWQGAQAYRDISSDIANGTFTQVTNCMDTLTGCNSGSSLDELLNSNSYDYR